MYYQFHSVLSPAKLNLGLKVIGKRPDGYHLLKSVFCLIDLYDKIDIQITLNGKVSLIEHQQAWFYQKDLAYKAAILLQEYSGCTKGANIKIKKVIPSGAGMGGGSSNAATVLIILNHLWETGLTTDELLGLGAQLGADVPFFIRAPTKDVFAALELDFEQCNTKNILTTQLISQKENDLEAAVRKIYPQINDIFSELNQYGKAVMTS